jgi:hypothetical protein
LNIEDGTGYGPFLSAPFDEFSPQEEMVPAANPAPDGWFQGNCFVDVFDKPPAVLDHAVVRRVGNFS